MDLLRSCYTTFMQFFDPPGPEIKVRWYWCTDNAEIFPGHTRFASGNWASDRFDWPGPGEVLDADRVWDNGQWIDGMLGDHHCGPDEVYLNGVEYPGVPLNGLDDGRCACCSPLPPPCSELVAPLPDTLRMRILNIVLDPPDTFPSLYVIGQEFDLVRTGPGATSWALSPNALFRDGCPNATEWYFGCQVLLDNNTGLLNSTDVVAYPPNLIHLLPFLAYFNGVNIAANACSEVGFGAEFWDVVIFDPLHPPP